MLIQGHRLLFLKQIVSHLDDLILEVEMAIDESVEGRFEPSDYLRVFNFEDGKLPIILAIIKFELSIESLAIHEENVLRLVINCIGFRPVRLTIILLVESRLIECAEQYFYSHKFELLFFRVNRCLFPIDELIVIKAGNS